jgi:amino acid permease
MLLCTNLALAEMAVLYPVNGAFYTYIVRFVDPSWGFACGWEYALSWLTVLPFELIAASKTIEFWRSDIHMVSIHLDMNQVVVQDLSWHLLAHLGIFSPKYSPGIN